MVKITHSDRFSTAKQGQFSMAGVKSCVANVNSACTGASNGD
jgi:hypothetical protein